jgi:hypothetical protein
MSSDTPTWYTLLISPFFANYPIILASTVACFALQSACATLSQKVFFTRIYTSLTKEDRRAWNVRMVAFAHALVAFTCLPGFLFPNPYLRADYYAYSPFSQCVFSIAAGYFLWDIVVCVWFRWGYMVFAHGVTCFLVFYLALHPFLHHVGRFYLGVYELSTPCLHVYKMLQLAGQSNTLLCKTIGILFALIFTAARIICGIPYSLLWGQDMIHLIQTGKAHSVAIVSLYIASNVTLNLLNMMWWGAILKIILKGYNLLKKTAPDPDPKLSNTPTNKNKEN